MMHLKKHAFAASTLALLICISVRAGEDLRQTPVVRVVAQVKDAVGTVYVQNAPATQPANPTTGSHAGRQRRGGGDRRNYATVFCITSDGYLIASAHTVAHAASLSVEFTEGHRIPATLVNSDADTDLAALKIKADSAIPCVTLGDSDSARLGESVVVVANSEGMPGTITAGVVSALHRHLDGDRAPQHADLIQTDAAINPGGTGAPVFDLDAKLIGIISDAQAETGTQAIAFATHASKLRSVIPKLLNPVTVNHVDVGFQLKESRGSNGEFSIGVEGDDTRALRTINGKPAGNIVDACQLLLAFHAGDPIKLEFTDGTTRSTVAKAVEKDALPAAPATK